MTNLSTATAPISTTQNPISRRTTATVVGVLFVVQMVTAMFGTSSIEAFVDGDTDRGSMTVGVLLMMASGLAVVGIGLLMYPVLKEVNPRPGRAGTRCSGSPSASSPRHAVSTSWPSRRSSRTTCCGSTCPPAWGASSSPTSSSSRGWSRGPSLLLGLVGYGLLTVGVPLDLLGVLDMSEGAGLLLVVPGGLFELVFFPIWLITKGFSVPRSVSRATT